MIITEVICIGGLFADITASPVIEYPEKGKLITVEKMQLSTGGCAANTSIILSKLGIPTALAAKAGNDELGETLIKILKNNNVDTFISIDHTNNTGCSMVLNGMDGERSFIASMGANKTLSLDDIPWNEIKKCKLLHLGGAMLLPLLDGLPTAEIFKKAKGWGLTTCLDTVWNEDARWWDDIKHCLPYTDVFLPSLIEAERITNKKEPREIANIILDAGVRVFGIKMGEKGRRVYTRDKEIIVPRLNIKAIDTNGAGDAYAAGFIAGCIRGIPLAETAYLANGIGAMATLSAGSAGEVKSFDECMDFIRRVEMY